MEENRYVTKILDREEEHIEKAEPVIEPVVEEKVEPVVEPVVEPIELDDDTILSYIEKKTGKRVDALERLFEKEELPEDVAAFHKFKLETGRSLEDYIEIQKDYTKVPEEKLLGFH